VLFHHQTRFEPNSLLFSLFNILSLTQHNNSQTTEFRKIAGVPFAFFQDEQI